MAGRKKARGRKRAREQAPRLWVPKLGIFLLRVFTGAVFLDAVYHKLWLTRMRPVEDGGLGLGLFDAFAHFVEHDYEPMVRAAVERPPRFLGHELTWYADFLESVMLPGAVPDVMGPLILVFELLLGLSLVLGAGVRLMAFLGALLMLAFGMAKGAYLLTVLQTNWMLLFILLALALTAAGRMWGLDARLQSRLPGWIA